jgi:hypothetical protein
MPAFPKLPVEELNAIQAFILNEAWAAYDQQQGRETRQPAVTAK